MRLLLDTHIALWALLEPERLSPNVRAAVGSPENELWLSPTSVWEALLLTERGRVRTDRPPFECMAALLQARPRREASISHEIAMASRALTLSREDPADRFLAATAKVLGLTLVTADKRLLESTEFDVMPNR